MKEKLAGVAVLVLAVMGLEVHAQNYSVDWYSIDGGGGTSTGGVYSVTGTIGQADAGHMSGGNYALSGGFWGLIAAVQTPGSPMLSVSLTPTNSVLVYWPYPSTGFNLQQSVSLATPDWASVTNAPAQVGQQWQVILQPSPGNKFYRLLK